jgi:predicted DNA-binding protein (MmcQ/YjbR family)
LEKLGIEKFPQIYYNDLPHIMSPSTLSTFLLSLPHVEQSEPFGPGVFVQKVGGKMFGLYTDDEDGLRLNLKCDPERAISLREQYEAIIPGYHMNKKHWNTLVLDGSLSAALVKELIRHSYDLVFASLPRKARESLR